MMRPCLTLATLGFLAASPATAEELRAPLVEIGANVSVALFGLSGDGPGVLLGGGPRLTINVTRQLGLEMMGEVVGPLEGSDLNGLYLTQIKFPVRKSSDGFRAVSLTVGVAGAFAYSHHAEVRISRPDRSTLVHPEYRRFRAGRPRTAAIGITHDRVLNGYTAGSFALQGLVGELGGLAVRGTVGLSFGRWKAR